MKANEVRKKFIKFFAEKEHKVVPSSPVVPYNDPTLLFTNAGMNQFKDVFLGTGTRDYKRAVDSQKCIRAGGKHNDLEEVGVDGYHHTFFEMLGNWSFGDYYKKDAIKWAWELLTGVFNLPKDKLWATVYETDDEALELWKSETDIDPSHILKFDEKDNFWEMGETGPCGPCSEIHIDLSENGCKPEDINAGKEDVIEIWNLVFIQYNRDEKRELTPLPKKHIDTGMGFERLVRTLQGKKSNYDTDLFQPIIKRICEITGAKYESANLSSINAIADHIRCLTFAIGDGAIPSNEGRGYVLRRILRRASRLARKLDYTEPFLYELVDIIVEEYSEAYPDLREKQEFIKNVIKSEEESFHITLDRGIILFNEEADKLEKSGEKTFDGAVAFKLYDTYGFPLDLTEVMARERGLMVDNSAFDIEMEKQRDRARKARKEVLVTVSDDDGKISEVIEKAGVHYDPYNISESGIETTLYYKEKDKKGHGIVIIKDNPFYSESGGQISDTGLITTSEGSKLKVIDSKKDFILVENFENDLKENESVKAVIDNKRRKEIQRNHSATHLVHEALKRVLGGHIKQMGSLVSDEYLRFDFPHFQKVSGVELKEIEQMVNEKIVADITVNTLIDIPIEEANKIPNVKKLFGEKYGDNVRVVIIEDGFSVEFCGGTHVKSTEDIGLFKIVKEESISSGTRRIFARTGEGILTLIDERIASIEKLLNDLPEDRVKDFLKEVEQMKSNVSSARGGAMLSTPLLEKILTYQDSAAILLAEAREKYLEEKKQAGKELLKKNLQKAFEKLDEFISSAADIDGIKVFAHRMELQSMDELKEVGEEMHKRFKNGIGLIAGIFDEGKINLVCSVSDNLVQEKKLSAGNIISNIAKELGGGGGGRPNLATAGAKDISKLDEVLQKFPQTVKGYL